MMPGAFELLSNLQPQPAADAQPVAPEGSFSKGLRGGMAGLEGNLAAAGGLAAERFGFGDEAKGMYDTARAKRAEAERIQQGMTSFDDVKHADGVGGKLRSGFDYLAGAAGGALPTLGVGAMGAAASYLTRGRVSPMAGMNLATAIPEAGDIAQRQDPNTPVDERFLRAAAGGLGSAVLMNEVPGMVAKGVVGDVAGKTVGQIGANAVAHAGGMGAGMAGAEGAREVAAGQELDPAAIGQAGAEGLAVGVPLAGAGAAAQIARKGLGAPVRAAGDALGKAKEAVQPAVDAVGDAAGKAKDSATAVVKDPLDALRNIGKGVADKAQDFYQHVADGGDAAGLKDYATRGADWVKANLPTIDADTQTRLKGAADDLLTKVGVSDETKAQVAQAAQNIGDKASQAFVATKAAAVSARDSFSKKLDAVKDVFVGDKSVPDADQPATDSDFAAALSSMKKSEDYSGVQKVIGEAILPEIRKTMPYFGEAGVDHTGELKKAADVVRVAIDTYEKGGKQAVTSDQVARLIDTFGDNASGVLTAAYHALGKVDPKERADFFDAVETFDKVRKQSDKTLGLMADSLADEHKDSTTMPQLRQMMIELQKWAQGNSKVPDSEVRVLLNRAFGDKANRVLAAIEKSIPKDTSPVEDMRAGGDKLQTERGGKKPLESDEDMRGEPKADNNEELFARTELHGREAKDEAGGKYQMADVLPEHDTRVSPEHNLIAQALERETKRNPDKSVSVIKASELGKDHPAVRSAINARTAALIEHGGLEPDAALAQATKHVMDTHGVVGVESSGKLPGELNRSGLKRVLAKADRTSTSGDVTNPEKNPSAFKAGKSVYDAVKLVREMTKQHAGESGGKSGLSYTAEMFRSGIAALAEHHGEIPKLRDDLVIKRYRKADGSVQDVTWGEAKQTLRGGHFSSDHMALVDLRERFQKAKAAGDTKAMTQLVKDGRELSRTMDWKKAVEQAGESDGSMYDKDGNLTSEGMRVLLAGDHHGGINVGAGRSVAPKEAGAKYENGGIVYEEGQPGGRSSEGYSKAVANGTAGRRAGEGIEGMGQTKVDPFGPTHLATRGSEEGAPIHVNSDGSARDPAQAPAKSKPSKDVLALRGKLETMQGQVKSAGAKKIVERALQLAHNHDALSFEELHDLKRAAGAKTATEMADIVNPIHERLARKGELSSVPKAAEATKAEAAAAPKAERTFSEQQVKDMAARENYTSLNGDAESEAFLRKAHETYRRMKEEERRSARDEGDDGASDKWWDENGKVYTKLDDLFAKDSDADLGSFFEDGRDDADVRNMLAKEVPASGGPKGQDGQGTGQRSEERTGSQNVTPEQMKQVGEHLHKVLGDSVSLELKKIMHAGEFTAKDGVHVIGISAHALDPVSVGYHESLHSFFQRLRDMGHSEAIGAVQRLASSERIMGELRTLLKGEHAAIEQLKDPEEAAAYAYQFWAAGKLTLGPKEKGFFAKIAVAVRKALGMWSNDERAQHILEYFHSGEFAKNMGDPSAVGRALIEAGKSQAFEKAKSFTAPLREMGNALATAGGQRLRATGIPALRELADAMKLHTTAEGKDGGFLPAARQMHLRAMNGLVTKLDGFTQAHLTDAMEAMQRGEKAATPEGKKVQEIIQGADGKSGFLGDMLGYMKKAGVNIESIHDADGKPYYPRVWDTSRVASHPEEFLKMLEKYKLSGKLVGDPKAIMRTLMAAEGSEFKVESNMPGMQFRKSRVLDFISHEDAAPWMEKNLLRTLNSYAQQATRRAEWSRRFGMWVKDDPDAGIKDAVHDFVHGTKTASLFDKGRWDESGKLSKMLLDAQRQGATAKQLDAAKKYVQAVDGTLGDTIDPRTRRLVGNALVYQNIRLLPLAIFSSVIDPLGIMVRGGTMGDAWKTFQRGVKEIKLNFKPGEADEATKFAQMVGAIDDATLQHTIGASYSQGMVGETGRKINDTFFRYNFMEQFNRSMRVGAAQAALAFMERHADGTYNKHSARYMRELGFEPGEYKSGQMNEKAKAAINRWVDGAVLRPDAADKPIWMSDPHYALFAHLKQFTYSFHETILKRVAHEYEHGNYAPAMALASYVPVMIAADAMKGLIQGAGSQPSWKQNWGPEDYLWNGVERAGLLGVGQFAADAGQGHIGSLAGPTIQQLYEGLEALDGKQSAGSFALKSAPANALYSGFLHAESADPKFAD